MFTSVKTEIEIKAMREGGGMLAAVLQLMKSKSTAGMTPQDMSAIAKSELKKLGGLPAFLGYQGYPDVICISVNNQVQHSIPDNKPFKPGDIVNFDFGVRYKGLVTDAGLTVCIDNKTTPDTQRLLEGTARALDSGIDAVKAGCRVGDISAAVEKVLKAYRLGIVRDLVGHGVGHHLHEDPNIPNSGRAGSGPVLKAGITIAIEPISTLGSESIMQLHDGWTLMTTDGSWSAQFEHTVLVTKDGAEILTVL